MFDSKTMVKAGLGSALVGLYGNMYERNELFGTTNLKNVAAYAGAYLAYDFLMSKDGANLLVLPSGGFLTSLVPHLATGGLYYGARVVMSDSKPPLIQTVAVGTGACFVSNEGAKLLGF